MESARCKAFVASVDGGSFTAAAETLGYTPSGVSQLVAALEKELGLVLLTRSKRGVVTTVDGDRMLPLMRAYLAQEGVIYETAASLKGLDVGSISIGTYGSVATFWLPAVIKKFQEDYPSIDIQLREGIRQEICGWLDEHIVDIAFIAYKDQMEYDWMPLAEDPLVAILPKDHPLAGEESFPITRIENEKLILTALGHDLDVETIFNENKIHPHVRFSTLENSAALALTEQGLGVCLMNSLAATGWDDRLVLRPLNPPRSLSLGIAMRHGDEGSPAVQRFLSYAVRMLTRAATN